jgi:hypothetical protein
MPTNYSIEELWDSLLSREPLLISTSFNRLSHADQKSVVKHLQKMIDEDGWLPIQKESAKIALFTIEQIKKDQIS